MGMMTLTFFLFFAFVVNIGMLVNAKINVQNAADLAAYAGAAVQARQMNDISFLNYQMRREYKKFLFRYYVMGSMSQDSMPQAPGAPGVPRKWVPNKQFTLDYGVPSVCMIFNANDNYCHLTTLPKISISQQNALDQINSTLRTQQIALESIRQENCGKIANTNIDVLNLWLFNIDPDFTNSLNLNLTAQEQAIGTVIKGISNGVGLVPRELLLLNRIHTLAGYVNMLPSKALTQSVVDGFQQKADPAEFERQTQAFRSAFNTLGDFTFDDPNFISMDELMPNDGNNATLLKLNDIADSFDTYAVVFQLVDNTGNPVSVIDPNTGNDCEPVLSPVTVNNVPFAVSKDPSTLVYYAIRLQAKAHLMFSPFGDLTLKAYAAAQPFGSRIGPPLSVVPGNFSFPVTINDNLLVNGAKSTQLNNRVGRIPNLPMMSPDSVANGKGWDTDLVEGAMYQAFFPSGASPGATIPSNAIPIGYQAAMSPNPIEASIYNIPNPFPDGFVQTLDATNNHKLWAPIAPPETSAQIQSDIQTELDQLFQPGNTPGNPIGAPGNTLQDVSRLKSNLTTNLLKYLATIRQGAGENGEGFNTYQFTDPFTFTGTNTPIQVSGGVGLARDPAQVKTSWSGINDSNLGSLGRVGYSVKFISFDSIQKGKLTTDGATTPNNIISNDGTSENDIPFIKH